MADIENMFPFEYQVFINEAIEWIEEEKKRIEKMNAKKG